MEVPLVNVLHPLLHFPGVPGLDKGAKCDAGHGAVGGQVHERVVESRSAKNAKSYWGTSAEENPEK